MRFKHLAAAATFMLFVGCNQSVLVENLIPTDEDTLARKYIDDLRRRDIDDIERHLSPSIVTEKTHASLEQMGAAFPDREPLSMKPVGVSITSGPSATVTDLTYEYELPDQWLVVNVALHKTKDGSTIEAFHVQPLADSYEHLHQFTFSGKSLLHYCVLCSTVAVPLFSLYALVACIRTPLAGRKWPWILFIIIGIGRLSLNWTTGQWNVSPLAIQLFSASVFAAPYGPWIVSVSLPFGALLFLLRKRKLAQHA
jgi:hypothetical protein